MLRFLENVWKISKTCYLPCLFSQRKFWIKLTMLLIMMQISSSENFWDSLKKKLLELHFFVYRSSSRNTLQQGMDYSLNFFGSNRKASNVTRFIQERNITFSDEIKKSFVEGNCDAFDDSIVDMLSLLAT